MTTAIRSRHLHIRVLLFASYAERLGHEVLELQVPAGTRVSGVLERLRALPGGDQLPRHPLCALNLAHVTPEAGVAEGDELAILPPLAGG
ncbi:MAG TPA: MoaD/ThiS family protein [Gemmatimonadales bacterium]|nr:MoaD/ThiS family protein [Gemmatimonadales bacterium]